LQARKAFPCGPFLCGSGKQDSNGGFRRRALRKRRHGWRRQGTEGRPNLAERGFGLGSVRRASSEGKRSWMTAEAREGGPRSEDRMSEREPRYAAGAKDGAGVVAEFRPGSQVLQFRSCP